MVPVLRFHAQPYEEGESAGEFLRSCLIDPAITSVTIVVAWVRYRGLGRLREELDAFLARGGEVRIIAGIDEEGATRPGLLGALRRSTEAYVFQDPGGWTFHPKVYLARGPEKARLLVGSSNLTPGGLYFNDEASLEAVFDLPADQDDPGLVGVSEWVERLLADEEACKRLDEDMIDRLVADARYRVSGHERRRRRAAVPLPEGAEEEDVAEEEEGGRGSPERRLATKSAKPG